MKILLPLGLILSALVSLTAFSTSLINSWNLYDEAPHSDAVYTYHFSMYLPDNINSFFNDIIAGAEKAAGEVNAAVSIHSINTEKNELEMAAYTGVDGVIVCPYLSDDLARRQLEKLKAHSIPVVLINHNIPDDQPWPFIGTNNFDMGRRIGLASRELNKDGSVVLAVAYSDKAPGIYAERELLEMGISAALGSSLSSPLISLRTKVNPLDAEALLYRLFSAGGRAGARLPAVSAGINTIVFTDPADTLAAAQTLVDMNLVGRVQIIGFGADPGILESIRKGIIACSVLVNGERIGYDALKSLAALRTTGYTSASIDIGIEMIWGGDLEP